MYKRQVFDQAFGEGVVKTEEEFRAKIKEEIAARFVADSDYKFLIDIRKVDVYKRQIQLRSIQQ